MEYYFFCYGISFAGLNLLRGKMFGMGSGVTAEVGFVFAIFVWAFLFHLLSYFFFPLSRNGVRKGAFYTLLS